MERKFSHFTAEESMHCPSKCLLFHDVLLQAAGKLIENQVSVKIISDEIKLRSGVWYNCNTKVVHDFAASKSGKQFLFLREEIISMADNCISDSDNSSPDEDSSSPDKDESSRGGVDYNSAATRANVFRARPETKLGILHTS